MDFLFGGIVISVVGVGIYVLVLVVAAILGIPLESRGAQAKRAVIAKQMQRDAIEAEAARNVAIRAAEKRLLEH